MVKEQTKSDQQNIKCLGNLWKTRISLESVHWAVVSLVDTNNPLCGTLGLPVAGKNISWHKMTVLAIPDFTQDSLPCSVPTINFVGIVGSYSRQVAPCACRQWQRIKISWFLISIYVFRGSLLLLQLGVEDQLLQWSGELPYVPPHDCAVRAGREELRESLALYPHGLVDGLNVRHRQADLPLRLASLPIVPPADLPVVAAPGQQVTVLRVELAGDQVVGRAEGQEGLGGVLCTQLSPGP